MTDDQRALLKSEGVDLKKAVADAATRVLDKLNAINTADPDVTAALSDMKDDITALQGIVPPPPPAPTPTPAPAA